ncbi:T9SS type A sorting domain-containing protein [Lewinella sp. IMCC34191]|uniref:T9SS type A sorting domain-containing protein n=1 Tax=Lewinella sp. IMCC34191 TaxID=2259172 RepID=UPI000E26B065|nr:T9SS type A sorting domain-containing protein [Lewinella sp. IMCC34191]
MQKRYSLYFFLFVLAGALPAQSVVVPADLDDVGGIPATYIDVYIEADTSATGEQLHDTYLLEAGGLYYFTKTNRWDFDVTIAATGDTETLGRPIADRANPTGGTSLDEIYRGTGSFYWDNIYLILGDEGPNAAMYETASFRPQGVGQTYSWNNCIIEKSRQGTIRAEGDSAKVFITNSILRNFGDYELFQGNGRVVDLRATFGDSVVIKNNVIHNILDRIYIGFRQRGLNYFEFSNNTVFNHVGRHGFIQLKNTKESVINDNFIQNPSIMGSAPFLADEQINFEDEQNFLFTLDSVVTGASIEMLNNNIHWTDDVLAHYEDFEPVNKPELFSPLFITTMTNDTSEAYFTEVLELNAVPDRAPLIQYSEEAVTDQNATGLTNIMVEDSLFAVNSAYDRGYLFDFRRFDPCYDPNAVSATAGMDGFAIGAAKFCGALISSNRRAPYNESLGLQAIPNPASDRLTLTYQTTVPGDVSLEIFDVRGLLLRQIVNRQAPSGSQQIVVDDLSDLPSNMYIAHLRTPEGRMHVKFLKQ